MRNEVEALAGVAPFVVVPGDQLHKIIVQCDARLGVKDTRAGFPDKVTRDDLLLRVENDALEIAIRGVLHGDLDVVVGSTLLKSAR